jgi:hypothetical protein
MEQQTQTVRQGETQHLMMLLMLSLDGLHRVLAALVQEMLPMPLVEQQQAV